MPDQSRPPNMRPPVELTTDFLGEDRHEFIAKLAYKFWTQRGCPLGSPEVDWFAAEQAVYASLIASGLITQPPNDPRSMEEMIYG
jgi:hypothetical protein